jgi:hypothetical protein
LTKAHPHIYWDKIKSCRHFSLNKNESFKNIPRFDFSFLS